MMEHLGSSLSGLLAVVMLTTALAAARVVCWALALTMSE